MIKTIKSLLLCLTLLGLSGCGDRINQENYQKIETGMKYDEVINILGEPSSCEAILTAKSCLWGSDTRKIDIKFMGDQVLIYSSAGLQ